MSHPKPVFLDEMPVQDLTAVKAILKSEEFTFPDLELWFLVQTLVPTVALGKGI
jgi:hypothetical protein